MKLKDLNFIFKKNRGKNMKKYIISLAILVVSIIGISFYVYSVNSNKTYENKEIKVGNNTLSMMLETSAGSGEYKETTSSTWPMEGYVFNENLSKCEKGSTVKWNANKNTVDVNSNVSDKCYVYFDALRYDQSCNDNTLSCYIAKQYTGTQGDNNLYFHDNTLTGGANDNSYRYSGSSDTTNNFVCFGYDSTDGTCPTDNLYRIIGIFDDQVKLIKYDYPANNFLGNDGDYYSVINSSAFSSYKGNLSTIDVYFWNISTGTNTWSESQLNTVNLNTNYLNNLGEPWLNKIANHTWKVEGNTSANIENENVTNVYKNEIINQSANTTFSAKVGLMYISDYGYAAAPSAWSTTLGSFNSSTITSVNWMFVGAWEWTILRRSDNSNCVFFINSTGEVSNNNVTDDFFGAHAVRPVFYLNSNVTYVSGNGTQSSPIIIK